MLLFVFIFFFFKQKTAYEMRISDWSSDVCSSDLILSSVGTTRTSRGAGALVYGEASALARGDEGGQRQRYSADPQPRRHAALDLGDGARAADDARARVADARRYACAIGRAWGRERVWQYVEISVVAVSLKKKKRTQ